MVTYLTLLYLFFVNFWNIKPFGNISGDTQLLIIALFLIFGYFKYKNKLRISINGKYKYLKWILVGIFLSMIPAYLFYGQPITQSVISYRAQYTIFAIPVLFVMSPKIEEIIKSLFCFSVLLLGANILIKYSHNLFVLKQSTLDRIGLSVSASELTAVAGIEYITIPLFYYLQQIKEKFTTSNFLKVIFLLFVIFTVENRSTLFPAIIFSLYTFIFIKSKYKSVIWIVIGIIGIFFVYNNIDVFNSLIEETTADLNNQDYNRNKAWNYFLYLFSPNWICYILGNGYLSAHYSSTMQLLMEEGIYNSDVGFIGYWNQFGIIPVVAIFTMYFSVLKKRNKYPFFMKLVVVYSIICGMTTIYYGASVKIMHLVLFYYLFYYYNKKQIVNKSI